MIDLKPACRQMSLLLTAVTDDQLTSSTPCSEYTVADLIEHVEEVALGSTAVAGQDGASAVPADRAHDGWSHIVAQHVQMMGQAWDDPAAWHGSTDAAGIELTNELWAKIALTEMVVHGWDLAQATDQSFELPEQTLQACLDHVREFVPNAPIPGLWGPAVAISAGAAPLDHVLGITGRTP